MEKQTFLDYSFNEVVGENGETYLSFRKRLVPKYSKVWIQIAAGYLSLCAAVFVQYLLKDFDSASSLLILVPIFGAIIGYIIAAITLFLHEASHYGLSKGKLKNDILGQLFIGNLIGVSLPNYRISHWQHHQMLGTTKDTENSYFNELNIVNILSTLFFVTTIRKILSLSRRKNKQVPIIEINDSLLSVLVKIRFAIFAFFHLALIGTFLLTSSWLNLLSWIIGVFIFFPFWGWLRQLLEHRSFEASGKLDYFSVDHGSISRIFKGGVFAKTFGAAGFDRHLLHHWDHSLSCTLLPEANAFLLKSNVKNHIVAAETTYTKTFVSLFKGNI